MVKRSALLVLLMLAVTALASPASASLTPMSWGFPVLVQNASLTGLQTQVATAHDIESADISFPSVGGGSIFGGAFPSIAQFADQGTSLSSLGFMNQNANVFFAYPYISIGGSPVPGMGFF
jgi:hypothetical protein